MDFLAHSLSKISVVALVACTLQAQQAPKRAPSQNTPNLNPGETTNGVYRNPTFGFAYKTTFGWVDRTKEMAEDSNQDSSADSDASKKSIVLLAAFERPPEASGDTVNSAVVVAAEPTASYPGLRSAEQYFAPLTELAESKGLTVVNEPHEFPVGETQMVRSDFTKPIANLTMHQSTLVMIEKGYVVSFTFIGGSEDEVDGLIEGLSFGRKETPAARK
ncbi:MAG: hypothetical protein WB711_17160 [Terriglobales bacterium]